MVPRRTLKSFRYARTSEEYGASGAARFRISTKTRPWSNLRFRTAAETSGALVKCSRSSDCTTPPMSTTTLSRKRSGGALPRWAPFAPLQCLSVERQAQTVDFECWRVKLHPPTVEHDPQTVTFECLRLKRDPRTVEFDPLTLALDPQTVERQCLTLTFHSLRVTLQCFRVGGAFRRAPGENQ